jgi:hypothetical protein
VRAGGAGQFCARCGVLARGGAEVGGFLSLSLSLSFLSFFLLSFFRVRVLRCLGWRVVFVTDFWIAVATLGPRLGSFSLGSTDEGWLALRGWILRSW